jgi:hypothetical protein
LPSLVTDGRERRRGPRDIPITTLTCYVFTFPFQLAFSDTGGPGATQPAFRRVFAISKAEKIKRDPVREAEKRSWRVKVKEKIVGVLGTLIWTT